MNKSMNLPQLQRIAMEFERENDIMEQRQEMMDDAVDDAMDVGVEEEGDEVVEQVLEEIGIDLSQAVRLHPSLVIAFIVANYWIIARGDSDRFGQYRRI
jgi:charged multivesicular body protein 2A